MLTNNNGIINCAKCQGPSGFAFTTKDYNRKTTGDDFRYYRCRRCGLIFLYPIPTSLDRYYPANYYPAPLSLEQFELEARSESYKLEMMRRFVKTGRVLDIGAGYGRFVYLAHKAGFEADAIEVSSECCEYIARITGTRAIVQADPEIALAELGQYDVITFWHVIEHLAKPWSVLSAAIRKLNRGGLLILATPNPQSVQFRLFKQYWAHVDAPRHLQLVPVRLLTRQVVANGEMQLVDTTTVDAGSLAYNFLGWTWSMRNTMKMRGVWRIGKILARVFERFEKTAIHGSCYTAIFKKVA